MFTNAKFATAAAVSFALSSPLAHARTRAHHHHYHASADAYRHHDASGYAYPAAYGYGWGGPYSSAAIISRAAARAQTEPGVTSELAPDAVQTATGGPSGGLPGFDGF